VLHDLHEALRLGVRQRPQEHGVHDAEDRRRRTEPDGKSQHSNDREPRRALEPAQRVPSVGSEFRLQSHDR
jgi:hypothetical protein